MKKCHQDDNDRNLKAAFDPITASDNVRLALLLTSPIQIF